MSSQTKSIFNTLKVYISLTKPRVLLGNTLSAVAGFLFAAGVLEGFDLTTFILYTSGITLVMGAACALNNHLDRDIDQKMERTKTRVTVTGEIGKTGAILFTALLGVPGIVVLYLFTNILTTVLAGIGFVVYVWLYGAWSKRKSVHGTAVGAISGAIPILSGYTAVSGMIDVGAVLIFLALFFWQFAEFFSISIYRREEYKKAKVPVVSLVRGVKNTKRQILAYAILFVLSTLLLTPFGYTGMIYFAVMAVFGIAFVILGANGLDVKDHDVWARKMFRFGMIMLLLYCVMISVGPVLP